MAGFGAKPLGFVCYLCGQQYGSSSLPIHVKKCKEMWSKRSERPMPAEPPELAEPLPKAAAAIEAFNNKMFDIYNGASLARCPGCSRTFNEEALAKHMPSCKGPGGKGGAAGAAAGMGNLSLNSTGGSTGFGSPSGPGARPKGYVCYLCGQQYGSSSLPIHIKKCKEMWTKRTDRPMPPEPAELSEPLPKGGAALDAFNQKMADVWNGSSLVPCPSCGRTFNEEALARHAPSCKGRDGKGPKPSGGSGSFGSPAASPAGGGGGGAGPGGRPKGYVCYLCGQQYGSPSLPIHIKKCKEMWTKRTDRPMPPEPAEMSEPLPKGGAALDAFNQKMADVWNGSSLVPCPSCGRTFNEEALARHAPSCKGRDGKGPKPSGGSGSFGSPAASPAGGGGGGAGPGGRPKGYVCYLCGQQYGSTSLPIHIKKCKEMWTKRTDRPMPPEPAEMSEPLPKGGAALDAFNQKMADVWNGSSLVPCPSCGRTFNEEALARHAPSCKGRDGKGPKPSGGSGSFGSPAASPAGGGGGGAGPGGRPKGYVCYLCGQQYGSSSLPIHVKKCKEMWTKRTSRAMPPEPVEMSEPLPKGGAALDAFNQKMADVWNSASLVPCPSCGRTFNEEALARHAPSCKGR
ncbi:unnamed protein product [Pedinophyceae sp. YPF-701]|nr:unnamed protein product [Pedinophyceae sp. YPF-701]